MSIEIIPGLQAFKKITKVSRWPSPDRDKERYLPFPVVAHRPEFEFGADAKFFTIGSCFAREVERALINQGMPVLSSFVEGLGPGENITNKYTTKSILQDLQSLFDEKLDVDKTIYEVGANKFVNLTFGGMGARKERQSFEDTRNLSFSYFHTLQKIREADVVVLTLGLVEVWYDVETQLYLNIPPPRGLVQKYPDRFELHVLSYDQVLGDLEEILSILRRVCTAGVRFLCTVSPVPLSVTFRQQDCLQADSYSKAVQRAAVEQIHTKYSDVSYFPSFEFVRLAAPSQAWDTYDYRHVSPNMVNRIMKSVIENYVDEADRVPSKDRMRELSAADPEGAIKLAEDYLARKDVKPESLPDYFRWYYGKALALVGRDAEALPFVEQIVIEKPTMPAAKRLLDKLKSV